MNASQILLRTSAGRGESNPFPPIKRSPFGLGPQPVNYDHVLPFTPPVGPDLYFYRGQFCGLRVKGAPVVPGSNANNPECVMACLLDSYPQWVQEEFFRLYCGYGYTHLQRSLGHALYYSDFNSFKALTKRAQGYGLFSDVWLIANEFPGFQFDQGVDFWKPKLDPYLDTLIGEGLIDSCCPCWQMDHIMMSAPGNLTIGIIAYASGRVGKNVPVFTHWINDACAWWKTGGEVWTDPNGLQPPMMVQDRFTWWLAMSPYLTGAHYQGNTTLARTDPQTYQGKLRDTLNPFNDGRMGKSRRRGFEENFRFIHYEETAQDQFGNDGQTGGFCTEREGDQVGYILTCTKGDNSNGGVMSGYGNGGGRPDGTAL